MLSFLALILAGAVLAVLAVAVLGAAAPVVVRRRGRPWLPARLRMGGEARLLRLALLEELSLMHLQAARFADELARQMPADPRAGAAPAWDRDRLERWRLTPPFAYPALAGRLGRLPSGQARRIRYFHSLMADARVRAEPLLTGGEPLGGAYLLLRTLVTAANTVDLAIRGLEAALGGPRRPLARMPTADRLLDALESASLAAEEEEDRPSALLPVEVEWVYGEALLDEAAPRAAEPGG